MSYRHVRSPATLWMLHSRRRALTRAGENFGGWVGSSAGAGLPLREAFTRGASLRAAGYDILCGSGCPESICGGIEPSARLKDGDHGTTVRWVDAIAEPLAWARETMKGEVVVKRRRFDCRIPFVLLLALLGVAVLLASLTHAATNQAQALPLPITVPSITLPIPLNPGLLSTDPADGATNIPYDPIVSATFNKNMDPIHPLLGQLLPQEVGWHLRPGHGEVQLGLHGLVSLSAGHP